MKNLISIMLGLLMVPPLLAYTPPFNKTERLKELTPIQYDVTQNAATEKPFDNAYWNNEQAGIYVDIVSKEPLFSSLDKYDSGTGWPSFTKPINEAFVILKPQTNYWLFTTTEVLSKNAKSHLGHVFKDGPKPTGLRYCMNSAAMLFIPKEQMEKEGYGEYLILFKDSKL